MITTLNPPASPPLTVDNQVIVFFESPGIIAKSFVQIFSYFLGKLSSRTTQDEAKWHKANINMLKGEKFVKKMYSYFFAIWPGNCYLIHTKSEKLYYFAFGTFAKPNKLQRENLKRKTIHLNERFLLKPRWGHKRNSIKNFKSRPTISNCN